MEEEAKVFKQGDYSGVQGLSAYFPFDDKIYQPTRRLKESSKVIASSLDFRVPIDGHILAKDSPMMNALTYQKNNF
jgi:hypothetical protein